MSSALFGDGTELILPCDTNRKGAKQCHAGHGYQLSSGDGNDIIRDADGQGSITLNGAQLTGGDWKAPNVWQKDGVTYSFTPGADGRGSLVISSDAGVTTIERYAKGELGISLADAPVPQPAPPD